MDLIPRYIIRRGYSEIALSPLNKEITFPVTSQYVWTSGGISYPAKAVLLPTKRLLLCYPMLDIYPNCRKFIHRLKVVCLWCFLYLIEREVMQTAYLGRLAVITLTVCVPATGTKGVDVLLKSLPYRLLLKRPRDQVKYIGIYNDFYDTYEVCMHYKIPSVKVIWIIKIVLTLVCHFIQLLPNGCTYALVSPPALSQV